MKKHYPSFIVLKVKFEADPRLTNHSDLEGQFSLFILSF